MSGAAFSVSVSVAELLAGVGSAPFVPSSATEPVFTIVPTPAATGLATVTANTAEPPPPAASAPTGNVQDAPTHTHAGSDPAALKVVFAGTVSDSTTPVAPWLPAFEYVSVYETAAPGVVVAEPSSLVIV